MRALKFKIKLGKSTVRQALEYEYLQKLWLILSVRTCKTYE